MSTTGAALTNWDEFVVLPDPEDGHHYELHDGELVVMPPPTPIHLLIQRFLAEWLSTAAQGRGKGFQEFPYRPAPNLQFWYADVAYVPKEDMEAMFGSDHRVYAPPLIIEVLSPSNRQSKIQRQRIAAFSAGTREFWVVDPAHKTVEVSSPGKHLHVYTVDDGISVLALPGVSLTVWEIFDLQSLTS